MIHTQKKSLRTSYCYITNVWKEDSSTRAPYMTKVRDTCHWYHGLLRMVLLICQQ